MNGDGGPTTGELLTAVANYTLAAEALLRLINRMDDLGHIHPLYWVASQIEDTNLDAIRAIKDGVISCQMTPPSSKGE